jgi:hypothetical protein
MTSIRYLKRIAKNWQLLDDLLPGQKNPQDSNQHAKNGNNAQLLIK